MAVLLGSFDSAICETEFYERQPSTLFPKKYRTGLVELKYNLVLGVLFFDKIRVRDSWLTNNSNFVDPNFADRQHWAELFARCCQVLAPSYSHKMEDTAKRLGERSDSPIHEILYQWSQELDQAFETANNHTYGVRIKPYEDEVFTEIFETKDGLNEAQRSFLSTAIRHSNGVISAGSPLARQHWFDRANYLDADNRPHEARRLRWLSLLAQQEATARASDREMPSAVNAFPLTPQDMRATFTQRSLRDEIAAGEVELFKTVLLDQVGWKDVVQRIHPDAVIELLKDRRVERMRSVQSEIALRGTEKNSDRLQRELRKTLKEVLINGLVRSNPKYPEKGSIERITEGVIVRMNRVDAKTSLALSAASLTVAPRVAAAGFGWTSLVFASSRKLQDIQQRDKEWLAGAPVLMVRGSQ